jgi:hypothetical protein
VVDLDQLFDGDCRMKFVNEYTSQPLARHHQMLGSFELFTL